MRKAQLSSVTRGETRIKPKRWWGERCEEERLLGVPCLSISSITALILCSVTFTRGLVGELGALLGCCTGESVPGGSGRTRTPVPKSQPGSQHTPLFCPTHTITQVCISWWFPCSQCQSSVLMCSASPNPSKSPYSSVRI